MLAKLQMGLKEIPAKATSELRFDQEKVGLLGGPVVSNEFQAKKTVVGVEKKVTPQVSLDPRQFVMEKLF